MPCVPGALHSAALLREEADPCPDADTALPRDRFPRETGRIRTNAAGVVLSSQSTYCVTEAICIGCGCITR